MNIYKGLGTAAVVTLISASILTVVFLRAKADSELSGIDYFNGKWTVTMKSNPAEPFNWELRKDLDGTWLTGTVERGGVMITRDFWIQRPTVIDRFAFTGNGTVVKVTSDGWKGDRLMFSGTLTDSRGSINVRETIVRLGADRFSALWERQEENGTWVVFSDEICTRPG